MNRNTIKLPDGQFIIKDLIVGFTAHCYAGSQRAYLVITKKDEQTVTVNNFFNWSDADDCGQAVMDAVKSDNFVEIAGL